MSFFEILVSSIKGMFPGFVYWAVLPLIPFIIAEQVRPGAEAPRWHDYSRAPHSPWSAQLGPMVAVGRLLASRKQGERNP
jgi:hypothetical protein